MATLIQRLKLRRKRRREHNAPNIAVIGGGSWATALVKILTEQPVQVHWWMRDKQVARHIHKYRHNPEYLSSVHISRARVQVYADIRQTIRQARYVLVVVPAAFVQDALSDLRPEDLEGKVLISAVKGVIPENNLLVTELLTQSFGIELARQAVIAGPCHAEEVALEKQSYLTIAAQDAAIGSEIAAMLTCRYIKASTIADVYGVEYAAVMKNIIALACGICHGLGYGDNFQAVLVSNATQEIQRFVNKINPCERDLSTSAYLGDLLVTAYSQFSRNRTFGNMIGRGYTVQSARMEMNMIAEGYYAVKSIYEISRHLQVNMPITKATYKILYERVPPALEISILKDLLH